MKLHVFFVLLLSVACKAKDPPIDLENDLKHAMQAYLYNAINNDSASVQYHVETVIYFNGKDKYICDFTVNMHTKMYDTTGIMHAFVSKDFKTVNRTN